MAGCLTLLPSHPAQSPPTHLASSPLPLALPSRPLLMPSRLLNRLERRSVSESTVRLLPRVPAPAVRLEWGVGVLQGRRVAKQGL